MPRATRFVLLIPLVASVCLGDQEASNVPHLSADEYGRCYAKSVPAESYGQAGVTRVYRVEAGDDQLVHTFDWYANQLYIACNVSAPGKPAAISLVRFGPWHRGHFANQEDLALAIYWGGELVASYSTLDIAGSAGNVSASVSHYTVIERVIGFEHTDTNKSWNEYQFAVETKGGQTVAFHAATGARLAASP